MYIRKALLLSAAAAAPALASPALNLYWGQNGINDSLESYCDSDGFEYITLSFMTASPEQDPLTNYPTTNFGAHCGGDTYQVNGHSSNLLSGCTDIQTGIQYCQSKGKKVFLSIGGVWGADATHNYDVSSAANGEYFAEFLWKAFGPVDPTWNGPRPFDVSASNPNVIDGFDFDIEVKFPDQSGYIALINTLQGYIGSSGGSQVITGAPQCPLGDEWFQMKDMITQAKFDKLFIQFYNNPGCQVSDEGFNLEQWASFLTGTASEGAELYVGLPGDDSISGYVDASVLATVIEKYQDEAYFGGVMLWDASFAKSNMVGDTPYFEVVHSYFGSPPSTTTTTATTTTSTSSSTTTTATTTTTSPSTTATTTTSPSTTTTTSTTSSSSNAPTTTTTTSSQTHHSNHYSHYSHYSNSSAATHSYQGYPTSKSAPEATHTGYQAATRYTTSIVYTTRSRIQGNTVVTETLAAYTTVCPIEEAKPTTPAGYPLVQESSEIPIQYVTATVVPADQEQTTTIQRTSYFFITVTVPKSTPIPSPIPTTIQYAVATNIPASVTTYPVVVAAAAPSHSIVSIVKSYPVVSNSAAVSAPTYPVALGTGSTPTYPVVAPAVSTAAAVANNGTAYPSTVVTAGAARNAAALVLPALAAIVGLAL